MLKVLWRKPSTRARLQILVDRLELPEDWTATECFASVERIRCRRIVRLPLPSTSPVGLCGLWLACSDYDVIFLRPSSEPTVELHVSLHEVGHMLLDHGRDMSISAAKLDSLLEAAANHGIDGSTARTACGVSSYDTRDEYEAELFTTLIGTRARASGPRRDRMLKEL
ncbi:hypothetical protein [Nocardia sp. NPDC051570]|uniref:hypothetical protein n=1 Tax=Nocardia sp. NPDC051570 TaxID=3364324 RepID=UPI0037A8290B